MAKRSATSGAVKKINTPPQNGAAWPATATEMVPIDQLKPSPRNARTHSQSQVLALARSLERFGWTSAVLRDEDGTIIAGHGRVLGAGVLVARGLKDFAVAPVMTARGWDEAAKRAYTIADNALALQAGWDPKLLETELKAISGLGFPMELLGFSQAELRNRLGVSTAGLTDPEAVPASDGQTVSRPGDLWMLGKHRVLCGDATSKTDVGRLFAGGKPVLLVTDPPYGVDYDPGWRNRVQRANGSMVGAKAVGTVTNDGRADWREAWALFPGNVAYVWHGGKLAATVQTSIEAAGFDIRAQIIWAKAQFVIGRGDYHWQHECCWYAVRRSQKANWQGGRKQSTIWQIAAPSGWAQKTTGPDAHTGIHSTQKMVECMRRPMENNSVAGDAVYDPFLGSGTSVIAAEQIDRACLGLEINPAYVDLAVRRWQNFTGKKALLSGRELSFEEIEGERKTKPRKGRGGAKKNGKTRQTAAADKPARDRRKPQPPADQREGAEAAAG